MPSKAKRKGGRRPKSRGKARFKGPRDLPEIEGKTEARTWSTGGGFAGGGMNAEPPGTTTETTTEEQYD
jgi:hypothetical protein